MRIISPSSSVTTSVISYVPSSRSAIENSWEFPTSFVPMYQENSADSTPSPASTTDGFNETFSPRVNCREVDLPRQHQLFPSLAKVQCSLLKSDKMLNSFSQPNQLRLIVHYANQIHLTLDSKCYLY